MYYEMQRGNVAGAILLIGGILALIVAAIQIYDRFKSPWGFNKPPDPIPEIVQEVDVSDDDKPFIGRLAEIYIAKQSNRSRGDIVNYVTAKKILITHVRLSLLTNPLKNESQSQRLNTALKRGKVKLVSKLLETSNEVDQSLSRAKARGDSDLLTRAYLAILVDDPTIAAHYFNKEADHVAEHDEERARHIIIEGADQLSKLGCQFGDEWLEPAISLYETILKKMTLQELKEEWTVAQNNLGTTVLFRAVQLDAANPPIEMLNRSLQAFRKAAENPDFMKAIFNPSVSIVFSNKAYVIDKLISRGVNDQKLAHELAQEQAIATRALLNNKTAARIAGGEEAVKRLEANITSMQIRPQWKPVLIQADRSTKESDPCQRDVLDMQQ